MSVCVAVVIPFFNQSSFTINCVKSILSEVDPSLIDQVMFYFVDDGSRMDEENRIKQFCYDSSPRLNYKYIKGDGTWWWAKSLSIGLKEAVGDGHDLCLLMNNDNTFEIGSLNNLIRIFIKNDLAILGSSVKYKNNKVKHFGVRFDRNSGRIVHNNLNEDIKLLHSNEEFLPTDSLGGQGVLVSKNALEKLCYLDFDVFPQYGSDLDFYLRAKKEGIDVNVTLHSVVIDDEDNTGLLKNNVRMTFSDFIKSFTSIKSHMRFSVKYNIYKRHVIGNYRIRLILLYLKYIVKYLIKAD